MTRLALSLALAAISTVFDPGAISAQQPSPSAQGNGVTTLRDCLVKNKRLVSVVLVDESQSLRGTSSAEATDPDAQRVSALRALLDSFIVLASKQGSAVDIDLLIAGFGADFSPVHEGWVDVSNTDPASLNGIAEQFRDRDDAVDTDYRLAMQGAMEQLDQRVAQTSAEGAACRLIVILSDGEYSLGPSDGEKSYAPGVPLRRLADRRRALNLGLSELCSPGGIVDQLRATGTVTIALGLKLRTQPNPTAELEGIAPVDFFTALATGSSNGFTCGNPDSAAHGAVATSDDFGRLAVEVFCAVTGCNAIGDPTTATVDRSISRLIIQAASTAPGLSIRASVPDGSLFDLPVVSATRVPLPGGSATVTAQSERVGSYVVDFEQTSRDQVGNWSFMGSGPGTTVMGITVQSNLSLSPVENPTWKIGSSGQLEAQLTIAEDVPVEPAELLGDLTYDVEVEPAGGGQAIPAEVAGPDTEGRLTVDVDPVPDNDQAALVVRLEVGGTIGTHPRPDIETLVTVPLRREGLPTVLAPADGVRLSGVHGGGADPVDTAEGVVEVRSEHVAGRACVAEVFMDSVPDGADGFRVDESTCVDVPAGATRELELRVAVDSIRSGDYTGTVDVALSSPSTKETATVAVPVGFAGDAPVCQKVLWLVLVSTILGVILVALLLLLAASRVTARFPAGLQNSVVYAKKKDFTVCFDPAAEAGTGLFGVADFDTYIAAEGERGPFFIKDRGTIRAQPHIFALPEARVTWEDGPVVGSRDGLMANMRLNRTGAIPHRIADGWAFGVRSVSGTGEEGDPLVVAGDLWAFIETGPGLEQSVVRLNSEIQQKLRGGVLRAVAQRFATVDEGDDESGSDPPTSEPEELSL